MEEQTYNRIQPDLWIAGTRITEPTIAFTSLIITLVCLYAWQRLRRTTADSPASRWTRAFFLLMGLSTLVGGLAGHAFLHLVPFYWKAPGWILGMLASAALAQATIEHARTAVPAPWIRFFTVGNWVELVAAVVVVLSLFSFHFVEAHTAFDLLIVVGLLEAYLFRRTRHRGSAMSLMAIGLAVLAVLPHLFKYSPSPWFTYFDLGHILLCGTMWCFMRAAELKEEFKSLKV